MAKKCLLFIMIVAFVCCSIVLVGGASCWGQQLKHTVQKGDTLWDICEKYYGDPDLWPKLWQMNPFVTNPHLLEPGDVITLLEGVPFKKKFATVQEKTSPAEEKAVKVSKTEVSLPPGKGIEVSGLTDVNAIGYLSLKPVTRSGYIFSSESDRKIMLSEEDIAYLKMDGAKNVMPGDLFTAYTSSLLLKHPLTKDDLGYNITFLGKIEIIENVEKSLYKAKILQSYKTVRIGDSIIPYEHIKSSCVKVISADNNLNTNIVAIKDQRQIIGQYTVVYLAQGLDQGVVRGNVFEIVRKRQAEGERKGWFSKEMATLPDLSMGYLLILDSRLDTSSGVVLFVNEDVPNGSYVKAVRWTKTPQFILQIPRCSIY